MSAVAEFLRPRSDGAILRRTCIAWPVRRVGHVMTVAELKERLERFRRGELAADEFVADIRAEPFEDIGFAKLDYHREMRQGLSEVVYGAGKTAGEIVSIVGRLRDRSARPVLVTRVSREKAADVLREIPEARYDQLSRLVTLGDAPPPDGIGDIVVATGGTSDAYVAEEAAQTAEFLGNRVVRISDVGVAGLERLLAHVRELQSASVVIAVAGMEGALATAIGGLVSCPVVAVPTSVGYGAAFEGLAALLAMLNSCAGGVTVVNIDNGFGAAVAASRMNHPLLQIRE